MNLTKILILSVMVSALLLTLCLLISFTTLAQTFADTDIALLAYLNHNRIRALDYFFISITDTSSIVTISIIVVVVVVALVKKSTELRYKGYTLLASVVVSALLGLSAKYSIDRIRPFTMYSFIEKLSTGGTPSFPSGHTMEVFTVLTILYLLFPDRKAIYILAVWAFLVAYSRMALGVHYPSDVAGGMAMGILVSILVYRGYKLKFLQNTGSEIQGDEQ